MKQIKLDPVGKEASSLFPVALITCAVLVITLFGVFWLRDVENADAARMEQYDVQNALNAIGAEFLDQAQSYAEQLPPEVFSDAMLRNKPLHLDSAIGVAQIVDLDREFDIKAPATRSYADEDDQTALYAAIAPIAGELRSARDVALRGSLSDNADRKNWGRGAWRIAPFIHQLRLAALIPFNGVKGGSKHYALLISKPIDGKILADVARATNTSRLETAPSQSLPPDFASLSFHLSPNFPDLSLTWTPKKPGDEIIEKTASVLLAFAAIFSTLIVFYTRRITRELVSSEAKAKAIAAQDPLTGLPNRYMFDRLLDSEMERVKRTVNDRGLAVHFLDLDRFKEVNDTFGHEAGDFLIISLTRRISGVVRSAGRLVRFGGDEFAILQTDVVGPRDAEILARHIVECMSEPFDIGGQKVFVSLSIGIALSPHDATEATELLRRADLALYRAKNEGRNRYCFFEQRMGDQLQLRKVVEDDLRAAIDDGALLVLYQPVMAINGKKMVGVEALVRWPHPTHGLISPTNFITLAEECGLILPLGEWVLRQALKDVQRWPGVRLAVNVSGIQFRNKDFVPMLQRLLEETGIDPARLELELTESVLLADADSAEDAMIDLRAIGIRLALDDFGTGYSSLIYLRRFAFDKIKIDRSFLESMESTGESAIIVHSIVHLGRALGLTVTAEGVENSDQHRFLQALGCDELQGYLFSKPVSAQEIDIRLLQQIAAENKEKSLSERVVA